MTQVQYFRDRWECDGIGTVIFAVTALMMIPYVVIGMMGGGHTLNSLSDGWVPYWLGGAIVAVVVMLYVFFGGMRGVAWVNALQTVLFLCFGAIAFYLISRNLGGYDRIMAEIAANPKDSALLTRARISPQEFFSYTFIPLSAMMFPHMAIMCLTAEKVTSFKRTVVWYPICILLIWLPSVYLGVVAAHQFPGLKLGESDDVILRLLSANTDVIVAGVLGAAIMACVMATDSQIMALSTMFSQDVFAHYGGAKKYGENVQVWMGRAFVIVIAIVSYALALALEGQKSILILPSALASPALPRSRRSCSARSSGGGATNGAHSPPCSGSSPAWPCSGGCNSTRTPSRRSPASRPCRSLRSSAASSCARR
jgi:SSS family solute:Na+ symporter